ncbi:multidrug effflux MFS transporter [Sneathiella marina]|uniref:Bcr/CflA family efflux transporter n=1 Tax=Sneathiella marina TaxID=2950108 RepID=A0ABY4W3E8_9PROT|nr:multidrug effflux MFS transporter [Sneathiella marina]USG61364.1 multidrug effflux MFS transporter [Sneathiella marina]
MRLSPKSISFTIFLSTAVAIGPLATDMYLPTFPMLADVFGASVSEVQLTLSIFTFTIAGCQLIYGPLTDRYGRKPILISGLFAFVIASFACLFAQNIEDLILYRFIQAFGVCAAIVVPRAMVRDLYQREMAAKQLSRMGTIMGFAPAIAPVLGGYLAAFYGWQSVFVFMGCAALLVALAVIFLVDESHLAKDKNALRPEHIYRNYRSLARDPEFMGFAVSGGLCFGGLFAFISGSPLVLIEVFGVAADHFGYYFGMGVLGFMAGTLVGPALTARHGLIHSLKIGTRISAVGSCLMLAAVLFGFNHVSAVMGPMVVYSVGLGLVLPQSQAGAMAPFPEKAGLAAALMGFLMMGFAAVLGYVIALLYDGTQLAMVSAIALMGILSFIVFQVAVVGRQKQRN